MKIPVKFLNFNKTAPDKGYWDMHFLETLFLRPEFKVVEKSPDVDLEMTVVIQGRNNVEYVDRINEYIAGMSGVLMLITSDEESLFPEDKLTHPNMRIWRMTPHAGRQYPTVDRFIGEGYTPHADLIKELPNKDLKWFFAGQVTHTRREKCVAQLRRMKGGELIETKGFTQGIAPQDYIKKMSQARIVPCPGGPATPDTFRMYEALEMACIPIVDEFAANNKNPGYWEMLFGEGIPFPRISNWNDLPGLIEYYNDTFTENSNKIFSWWQQYKQTFLYNMINEFAAISGSKINANGVTVVVPTSPIASNPDTSIIDETIQTIRHHFPSANIIITFDGVREEQQERKADYEEYKRRVLWKCNKEWGNCFPIVFNKHMHQVGMMRAALKYVNTDKVLYVEHDTPLTPDMVINWKACMDVIDRGQADLVRFHFESLIPKEHDYLMLDKEPMELHGAHFIRTVQWSQRPHLASTSFYKRILEDHFTPDANSFIEDKMHSVVVEAHKKQQLQGWNQFRLMIYHPTDGNIKRSYHTDGRASENKFDDTQKF